MLMTTNNVDHLKKRKTENKRGRKGEGLKQKISPPKENPLCLPNIIQIFCLLSKKPENTLQYRPP